MSEPEIIGYGRSFIDEYSVEELRSSLVRAFVDRGADFVVLDSNMRGQKFLAATAAWAIDEGLLYNDRNEGDGQQKVSTFRLTEKGKTELKGQS